MSVCMYIYVDSFVHAFYLYCRSAEEDTALAERSLEDCLDSFSKQESSCAALGPLRFPVGRSDERFERISRLTFRLRPHTHAHRRISSVSLREEELCQDDWVWCDQTQQRERSLKKIELWTAPECLKLGGSLGGKGEQCAHNVSDALGFVRREYFQTKMKGCRRWLSTEHVQDK